METGVGLRGHRVQSQERAEERRRQILMAGANVFAEKGYAAASVDDIAARMGITKGVVYYYFASKEELYTEIKVTAVADAVQRLEDLLGRYNDPRELLKEALTDLIGHMFGTLDWYAIVLHGPAALGHESRERIREMQRRYERLVQDIIEAGMREGVFATRDPKITTFTILRASLGVAAWYRPEGPLSPETVVQQVTEQIMGGVEQRCGRED